MSSTNNFLTADAAAREAALTYLQMESEARAAHLNAFSLIGLVSTDAYVDALLANVNHDPEPVEDASESTNFEGALHASPTSSSELIHNSQIYTQMGEWEKAKLTCQDALKLPLTDHEKGIVGYNFTMALFHLERIDLAIQAVKNALTNELEPHHEKMILGLRAEIYLSQGNLKAAEDDISKALEGLVDGPMFVHFSKVQTTIAAKMLQDLAAAAGAVKV
ncbi:MAG: tetratricopeptide repeat protein [Simkaniaceae bacterium]|nr:tetratricopeptide repeat protein [Candidatus Sacchlamyda saccharinae]